MEEDDDSLEALLKEDLQKDKRSSVKQDSIDYLFFEAFVKLKPNERFKQIDKLMSYCDPSDLMYLNKKLNEYKRDFISLLPIEIVEQILSRLDWRTLFNCCQVCTNWNERISNSFNKIWLKLCFENLPIDQLKLNDENCLNSINYKTLFVNLLKKSKSLESGADFKTCRVGPTEINALGIYKNILATATHVVKFWEYVLKESGDYEWESFNSFQLQSRASGLKFDDTYLVVSTYFLSIDLYSLKTNQFLFHYYGHTCSITCFDFNQELKLIVSGSPDNTIKFWSMDLNEKNSSSSSFNNLLVKTEVNCIWPVKITFKKFDSDYSYLVIALCTNGFIYVVNVSKVDDFNNKQQQNSTYDTFNFKYKLKFSDNINFLLDAQLESLSDSPDEQLFDNYYETGILVSNKSCIHYSNATLIAYLITENNANQRFKMYIKKWVLSVNEEESELSEFRPVPVDNKFLEFLNQKNLRTLDINQYEIIAFGFSFCLFADEKNNIYLANLKSQQIKCIQNELNLDNKMLKIFKLSSSIGQEQFIFGDRDWLNGFEISRHEKSATNECPVVFTFYTQRMNEVYVVLWNK